MRVSQGLAKLPTADGFFNIPVVDVTGLDIASDADALNSVLEDQGDSYLAGAKTKAMFCSLRDFADGDGVKFVDQLPADTVELFEPHCDITTSPTDGDGGPDK